jgi:ABC-type Fe3+ transport system permease subunit
VLRRSRLALLCGIWGFFFMVLGVPYVTLLLGALALYWGVSALRGEVKPSPAAKTAALTGVPPMPQNPYYPQPSSRPHVPAALGGVVAGAVSLALVAVVFGVQLYYKSYYDCQANALTKTAYDSCATSVSPRPPVWLTQLNGG